jgi:hypothetical protein
MNGKNVVEAQHHNSDLCCTSSQLTLLRNIVEAACLHEPDLTLSRLLNLLDLYRVYLASELPASRVSVERSNNKNNASDCGVSSSIRRMSSVSFERFIGDSRLLSIAAAAASHEYGETVATPPPVKISANAGILPKNSTVPLFADTY